MKHLMRVTALAAAILFAFGMVGCGGAMSGTLPTNGTTNDTTGKTGSIRTVVRLADLNLPAGSTRGGYLYSLYYELTNLTNQTSMARHIAFNSGEATIDETLEVGSWSIMANVYEEHLGAVLSGSARFAIVANQVTPVSLTMAPPTGSAVITVTDGPVGFKMEDVTSEDGQRLSRNDVHRFTWTPQAKGNATWCRLYIDMLHFSSNGTDGNYTPADVKIVNFDSTNMSVFEAGNTDSNGVTTKRITQINAKPGVTVIFTVGLKAWPPYDSVDYSTLQLGRVNDDNPKGYHVVGKLPIYETGKG